MNNLNEQKSCSQKRMLKLLYVCMCVRVYDSDTV